MRPEDLEHLPWLALLYAAAIYAAMAGVASWLLRNPSISAAVTSDSGRHGSLDGLRGLLAAGVFVHHSFTALIYAKTGQWDWSASAVLNHFGQTTVALFFMITGFLFTVKVWGRTVDWPGLYISRVARLAPLYFLIVPLVFVFVWALSDWELKESAQQISKELFQWLSFSVLGRPDINAYPKTWTLIAGVNWSLRYEWVFYIFALAPLYWVSRAVSISQALVFFSSILLGLLVLFWAIGSSNKDLIYLSHFVCGILAALLYTLPQVKSLIQSFKFKLLATLALLALFAFNNSYAPIPVLLSFLIFMAALGGISGWGILLRRPMLLLGDISYGIYLIHGLILSVLMITLKQLGVVQYLDLYQYTVLVMLAGVLVVVLSTLSYLKLEKPAIEFAKNLRLPKRVASSVLTARD